MFTNRQIRISSLKMDTVFVHGGKMYQVVFYGASLVVAHVIAKYTSDNLWQTDTSIEEQVFYFEDKSLVLV